MKRKSSISPPRRRIVVWSAVTSVAAAVLCVVPPAAAQHAVSFPPPPVGVVNEFRYLGGALVCISENEPRPRDRGLAPCLHIGAIAVDETTERVDDRLGRPWKVVGGGRGETIRVYPIHGDPEANPYFAVTFKAGRATAIQLSGEETPDPYSFSGLRLGDSIRLLKDVLGPVTASEKLQGTETTLLSYQPFPISIEVKNRKVVSIKIWAAHS
ncbi:MAG TPA: hypothetical protein VFS34_00380 [Thermoanaerobaculia bacterium]|nr:hypothetical protein [Thermoanaerobaculia bacterium]